MRFEIVGYSDVKFQKNIFYDDVKHMIVDHHGNQHKDFKLCKVATVMKGYDYHSGDIKNNSIFKYDKMVSCSFENVDEYNNWRNTLAKILQYNPSSSRQFRKTSYIAGAFDYDTGPFLNLICYIDYNGVINHKLCSELLADFEKYISYVDNMPEDNFILEKSRFITIYNDLMKCFKSGSDYGLVQL